MWRTGALLFTLFVCVQFSSAFVKSDFKLLERLKRSPNYCGPYWPPPPPPPPPPPFWPPGPPPPWGHHHHHRGYGRYEAAAAQAAAEAQDNSEAQAAAAAQAISAGTVNQDGSAGNVPCATCGGHGSTAVSNANSNTRNAIAVAIAKPNY